MNIKEVFRLKEKKEKLQEKIDAVSFEMYNLLLNARFTIIVNHVDYKKVKEERKTFFDINIPGYYESNATVYVSNHSGESTSALYSDDLLDIVFMVYKNCSVLDNIRFQNATSEGNKTLTSLSNEKAEILNLLIDVIGKNYYQLKMHPDKKKLISLLESFELGNIELVNQLVKNTPFNSIPLCC